MNKIPVSVVIPTRDRPDVFLRTVDSILSSTAVPEEFVVVDASEKPHAGLSPLFAARASSPRLIVRPAAQIGAAAQRNQALTLVTQDHVLFCDDDIICEPDCIARLWQALQSDASVGGASAA